MQRFKSINNGTTMITIPDNLKDRGRCWKKNKCCREETVEVVKKIEDKKQEELFYNR